MPAPSTGGFQKQFPLDSDVLGPNSAASVSLSVSTDADVVEAVLKDTPFPARAGGKIELGRIQLEAQGGGRLSFDAGQGTVGFSFSTSFRTGAGVFDQASDAIGSLQLDAPPKLDLTIPKVASSRYLLMLCGYRASGSFSGSHPIGALGTVSFGAQASGDSVYAVLHRFGAATGAATVLGDTIGSWRLPRHVSRADDLRPGTWLLAEADGSVALKLAAQLGYDFNFVREAHLLGATRELGVKIDAGVKASFGFQASGKYIVVVGRETDTPIVLLRIFKQSDQGFNFGLNLAVGVTGKADLPANIDDFVKAVFGVHGLQVVKDLHLIEEWTDPTKDLGETAARLINSTGLDLLTHSTGIDARKEFDKARKTVLDAFRQWDALPDRASSALWGILGRLDNGGAAEFKTFLSALADPNPATRSSALAKAIQQTTFGDTPEGQWLESLTETGLLALAGQLETVQQAASQTLNILNGGVLKNLQDFINERLNLDKIRDVVTQNDFDKLDGWLVKRLGDFLDKELNLAALDEIRTAIHLVIQKASDIYQQAIKALTNRYSLDFAASYQRSTTDTALLDASFDLSQPDAGALLKEIVANSRLDDLLVKDTAGVTLNMAALTHGIKRNTDTQVHMPFFDARVQHVNDSLASLKVENDSGRVLAYQLAASDTEKSRNRYMSQLSVLARFRVRDGKVELGPAKDQTVAYESLQVKSGATLAELEFRTRTFLRQMFAGVFTDDASLDRFYMALDQTVSGAVGNRNNNFGDVALNLQVVLPASVLAAWFEPRTPAEVKSASMMMSRALQAKLKELIPSYFFQDLSNLQPNPAAAALLVWAALPVSTSIDFRSGEIRRFDTEQDVFWNFPDGDLRRAAAMDTHTGRFLAPALVKAHERWLDVGNSHTAAFFASGQAGFFQQLATNREGDRFLQSLLFTESQMVRGAAAALTDMQEMLSTAATAPTKAISRFARYGADLTDTFNRKLSEAYGNESLRTLNSMLLVEAARAIGDDLGTAPPTAMLTILVLSGGHKFQLADYLKGDLPPREEIALAQTLTNLA